MLILIELNELCPNLLQDFMARGLIPNFRALYDVSTVFTTDAGEQPPNLEPWIQWVTVHSGMKFSDHRVFHLGEGRSLKKKCVAELLSDAGVRVGVFGSMNLNYGKLNGYLVPDPWDKQGMAQPDWMQPFYETVARQVQESSAERPLSKKEMIRFGWFLVRKAFSPGTLRALAGQLLRERRDPGVKWQRAMLLDRIQYDLFRRLNRRLHVQFATFFCNSTAHFQHYYWRNMRPDLFEVPPPSTDHPSLRGAILLGYQAMDRLVGRFLRDYPRATLMLCTGLSQQPWIETTKCTYRPRQFQELLDFSGITLPAEAIKPVMAEEFHLECPTEESARSAETRLNQLWLDDEPLMKVERKGTNLFAGCRVTSSAALEGTVRRECDGKQAKFGGLFHMVHSMRSGRHHPDGVLWVRCGRHEVVPEKIPLTCVAPTILSYFGVPQPAYMTRSPLSLGTFAEARGQPIKPSAHAPIATEACVGVPGRGD